MRKKLLAQDNYNNIVFKWNDLETGKYTSMEGLKNSAVRDSLQTVGRCMKEVKKQGKEMTIESISFCVDNDGAGQEFAESYINSFVLDHGDETKL